MSVSLLRGHEVFPAVLEKQVDIVLHVVALLWVFFPNRPFVDQSVVRTPATTQPDERTAMTAWHIHWHSRVPFDKVRLVFRVAFIVRHVATEMLFPADSRVVAGSQSSVGRNHQLASNRVAIAVMELAGHERDQPAHGESLFATALPHGLERFPRGFCGVTHLNV